LVYIVIVASCYRQIFAFYKDMAIAVTMGDPSGIGPELVLRAYFDSMLENKLVIGSKFVLEKYRKLYELPAVEYNLLTRQSAFETEKGALNLIDAGKSFELPIGRLSKSSGLTSFEYVQRALRMVLNRQIRAIVTLPINKQAINMAGFNYSGHTDFFSKATGAETVMTMASEDLIVSLVTDHIGLSEVVSHITKERLSYTIETLYKALRDYFGKSDPKIAVLGVNPHAGDGGVIGKIEESVINPVVRSIRYCDGAISPDTAFSEKNRKKYDGYVAMYHDQGLIPFKMLHFSDGVNVSLGLPFIRTSVDHGTAFDIAGLYKAETESFYAALEMAEFMSNAKN